MTASRTSPRETVEYISYVALVDLLERIFMGHGTSAAVARTLAANCAMCERDGAASHGIFRIPGYVSSLTSGWVNGKAVPSVEAVAPSFCRVDAMNGFAQPALEAARPLLVSKVKQTGVALLATRNSHHFGALWPDIEPFAHDGFIALTFVNSFACTVPHGAQQPVFGTNPLAFVAPRADGDPIVFDMATSAMSHGDIQIAAREEKFLPPGIGLDHSGNPTVDPTAVLQGGALLPFGGHKGSALSMMIELLSAALTGGNFSFEFDWSGYNGAQTPHTGQLVIVIDPMRGWGAPFRERAEHLVRQMRGAGLSVLPGERRYRRRREISEAGVLPISSANLAQLRTLAD